MLGIFWTQREKKKKQYFLDFWVESNAVGQLEIFTGLSEMRHTSGVFFELSYIEGGIEFQWCLLFFYIIYPKTHG